MSQPLTHRMQRCVEAIRRLTVNGVPPSLDDLREDLDMRSKGTLHTLLTTMKARGLVEWTPRLARSLRLTEEDLSPARLDRLTTEQLREGAAHIASRLAHREGRNLTGSTFRRIAERIELKPNEVRA